MQPLGKLFQLSRPTQLFKGTIKPTLFGMMSQQAFRASHVSVPANRNTILLAGQIERSNVAQKVLTQEGVKFKVWKLLEEGRINDHFLRTWSTRFSKLSRQYIIDMETKSGISIGEIQRRFLKNALQQQNFMKLSPAGRISHAKQYRNAKDQIIKQWEGYTGQTWPTTLQLNKKTGNLEPVRHQIHHIIPQEVGGPHVWWNAHPLEAGAAHQGGVHSSGSPLNQILKDIVQ
jgi:hypothetical protein